MRALRIVCLWMLLWMPLAALGQGTPLPPVQPPGGGGGPFQGGANNPRRAQVQAIVERYKSQRQGLKAQIQQQREELGQMLRSNASPAQTQAKLQGIIQAEGQIETLTLQEYYELSAALPPQARAKYTERIANQVTRAHRAAGQPGVGAAPPGNTP